MLLVIASWAYQLPVIQHASIAALILYLVTKKTAIIVIAIFIDFKQPMRLPIRLCDVDGVGHRLASVLLQIGHA